MPIQEARLINNSFLEQFRKVSDALKTDAEQAQQAALAHNRAGHEVLLPELFPAPDPRQREVLPRQFYDRLVAAYQGLLQEINAGSPPSVDALRQDVEQREERGAEDLAPVRVGSLFVLIERVAVLTER